MRRGAWVLAALCIAGCGGGGGSDGGGAARALSIGAVSAVPSGGDEAGPDPRYSHLDPAERARIVAILRATHRGLPEGWLEE